MHKLRVSALVLLLVLLLAGVAAAGPGAQTPALALDEAQTIYLGNLARRENGRGPLRANRQLTSAARWFAWDSVENRAPGFCGHTDSQGHTSDYRARVYGYKGSAGAENAFCDYLPPAEAIARWLKSPAHHDNLLDPTPRETGLGYYRRGADGPGYIVHMFGFDNAYAPVVINNEAPSTTAQQVQLYIYNRPSSSEFGGLAPATSMRIANEPCFAGAGWQPYQLEPSWSLAPGTGWRTVYVQTRDALGRTATVSDTIFLGASLPADQLGLAQQSTTASNVTIYGLNGAGLGQVQFSPGWVVDDTYENFTKLSGNGERVSDSAAVGGSAFRLGLGDTSTAWVWTTEFVKDTPLVAYLRLKVDSNASADVVGSFSVKGGGQSFGPLALKGTDFSAAGQYQEFAMPFTFVSDPDPAKAFLIFDFARVGDTALYVDSISIYSAPQPLVGSATAWAFPGGNYRGQGIQVRYTNGAGSFSAAAEARTMPVGIQLDTSAQTLLAAQNGARQAGAVGLQAGCLGGAPLEVASSASWLSGEIAGGQLRFAADLSGLAAGTYQGTLTVGATGRPEIAAGRLRVKLVVAKQLSRVYAPLARK